MSHDSLAGAKAAQGGSPAQRIDFGTVRDILPHLIDSLADAVLVVDRDLHVVAANRRYMEAFGTGTQGVVGATCHDVMNCPEAQSGSTGHCAACDVRLNREPRRMVRTVPDATGAMRRWEATLTPVLGDDGDVGYVVEVWRDTTERTQLEAQLSHGERLASLGVLAAGVAHEVNNPLASILAGVESLKRWLERTPGLPEASAEEARDVIEVLERETQRSRETTDKLMLLAQPYQVAPGWIDLNQAARDTLALLRYQMRKQQIEANDELDPDLPAVWARGAGLRGMLMNLCLNAVQAMPEGGALTVRTSRLSEDRVRVEIEDNGPGILPQHVEHIWDPFFTTKPVGSGTGLGLSITQRIVQRHGGTIRVESPPGGGAHFVVDLPVRGSGGGHV